jgi:hypothetical protein
MAAQPRPKTADATPPVSKFGGLVGAGGDYRGFRPAGRVLPTYRRGPGVRIDNGGSVRLTFPPVDLRPHAVLRLPEVVLVAQTSPAMSVTASWQATSTGMDGVIEGDTLIPLGPVALTPAMALADPDSDNI